jgi:hypothetical protein
MRTTPVVASLRATRHHTASGPAVPKDPRTTPATLRSRADDDPNSRAPVVPDTAPARPLCYSTRRLSSEHVSAHPYVCQKARPHDWSCARRPPCLPSVQVVWLPHEAGNGRPVVVFPCAGPVGFTYRRRRRLGRSTFLNMSRSGVSVSKRIGRMTVSSRGRGSIRLGRGFSWRFKL